MNIIVQLVRKGWVAVTQGEVTVHVRGQAYLEDECLDSRALAERFASVACSGSELPDFVKRLNGNWAVVVHFPDSAFISVDHIRSIQLLYSQEDEGFYVFDDVNDFRKEHKLEVDDECAHEYLSSGYVYRNRTLFKKIYSLQAAEYVVVSPSLQISCTRYWRYIPNINKSVKAGPELVKKIDDAFLAAMRRLVESVGDKRIVVPLSGGYDSRLIVNYLYKLGVKNVLCYTYGLKGNGESWCSKDVANKLGYEWHYVEYTPETYQSWLSDSTLDDCYRYMCNGTNRPCFQEYFAVRTLRDRGTIDPKEDTIVPGYYFDVLAGSKIMRSTCGLTAVTNSLADENNFFLRKAFCRTSRAIASAFSEHADIPRKACFETFLWQERLAKFIVNAVRMYELLGFDWRLPVCDCALFDLWLSLPYSLRVGRKYFYSIFPRLAVPEILNSPVHGQRSQSIYRCVRHVFGTSVPYVVKYWLFRLSGEQAGSTASVPDKERKMVESCVATAGTRFVDGMKVSPNAALSLKSFALMLN